MTQVINKQKTTSERFWEKVDKIDNGCWRWVGAISNGYGRFYINGKICLAHRVAFEWAKSKIPTGMTIDHLCRNRWCVNPDHLDVVSLKDNLLRGIGPTAIHAQATHCPQGHPYDLINTYFTPNGYRDCRICKRVSKLRWIAKHKKEVSNQKSSLVETSRV